MSILSTGEKEVSLERTLTVSNLVFLSIGAIVGSGIFMIPGIAASIAGPQSLIVWLCIGFSAILMAMSIAELAGMYPSAGGFYYYAYEAYGRFMGFLVGWCSWVISWITIAMLVSGFIEYLTSIVTLTHFQEKLVSIGVLIALYLVNLLSARLGANLQVFFSVTTLIVLGTFIVTGIGHIDTEYYFTYKMPNVNIFMLLAAAAIIIEPFIGWETVTFLGEEAIKPEKTVPKALVLSTLIIVFIYSLAVIVTLGVTNYKFYVDSKLPALRFAANITIGKMGGLFIAIGAVIILLGTTNSWIMSASRLPYALAKDGLIPGALAYLHPKYKTPVVALTLQTIVAGFLVLLGVFELLLHALVPIALINYTLIFFSVIVLRVKKPGLKRHYKIPGGFIVPLYSGIVSLTLLLFLAHENPSHLIEGLSFVVLGIPLYFFIEFEYDEKFIIAFNELLAPLYDKIAPYVYTNKLRKNFIRYVVTGKDSVTLDLACHTGLFVPELAKKSGLLIATDVSYADIDIAKQKTSGYDNIIYIRADPEYLPFRDESFSHVVGFGISDEAIDSKKIFSEIKRILKRNGRATILVFESPLGVFASPVQWSVEFIEDYLEKIGMSYWVKPLNSATSNGYLFLISKRDRQMIRRISGLGIFRSFYYHHIVRKFY